MKVKSILLFVCLTIVSNARAQYTTGEKRIQFYLDISKKYSPDSYHILISDADREFIQYSNNQESWDGLLENYGTVVHETCHSYNWKIGLQAGLENEGVYVTDDVTIAFRKGLFVPSSGLNTIVTKEQREKIFRYETYVGGESLNSSTQEGIYGFIDEFSAYYHDIKGLLEVRSFYEAQCSYSEPRCWVDKFLSRLQSTTYAYNEFQLFMAWYLIYTERKEPKVFSDIITNQNLRVAYTLLNNLFKKEVENYFKVRKDVVDRLIASGSNIEITDLYLFITAGFTKTGTGIPDDEIAYLKTLYTPEVNKMLGRFSIKGVDLTNYKSYLEIIKK